MLTMLNNYIDCVKFFDGARDKAAGRPIAKNLRLYARGDRYAICYYATDIITFHVDGTVSLYTGNRFTKSTRDWINSFSPVAVSKDWTIILDGRIIPFREHMRIDLVTLSIVN